MPKKRPKAPKPFYSTGGFWIAVALIAIAYMYQAPIMQFVNSFGNQTFSLTPPTNQLPPPKTSCTQYDFEVEFDNYFGAANMDILENVICIGNGGVWTGEADEVSCHLPRVASLDCNNKNFNYIENLCDNLKGNYVCSNVTKFVGCLCKTQAPSAPLDGFAPPSDEEQESDYTCGWTTYGMCQGTCPSEEICTDLQTGDCACIPESDYIERIGTIFVTSNSWSGAIGGLAGADDKCQVAAQYAGLSGTWKAIMSDTSNSAYGRLPDTQYYRMDGVMIATGKADLFDGSINAPINIDEHHNQLTSPKDVWTGVGSSKGIVSPDLFMDCHNWGWVSTGYVGIYGNTGEVDGDWIYIDSQECEHGLRLYCARVS